MKRLIGTVLVWACIAVLLPSVAPAAVGDSDNGLLLNRWYLDLNEVYGWGWFGATPAVVNLPGVNSLGGEPDKNLEIVTGSDGLGMHFNPDTYSVLGLWRAIDSGGNVEWYRDTQSDEARGSVAVADVNQDGNLEIVGGTTSGHTIEVMDRFGNFLWTFPNPPESGSFEWPAAPAVADLDPDIHGLEIVEVHRPSCTVVALAGAPDGVNHGITFSGITDAWSYTYTFAGTEGTDWDVLWTYTMLPQGDDCNGSAAIGDVDHDGKLEVVVGNQGGNVFVLDGATGMLKTSFSTGSIQATPSLANVDCDPYLEIVVGDLDGNLYVFGWDGTHTTTKASVSLGSAIYSSAGIGNINAGAKPEIVAATEGGQVYAFDGALNQKWVFPDSGNAGMFYASPTLADRANAKPYAIEWQMFRHDAARTGNHGPSAHPMDVFIGSMDGYLYLINGRNGKLIDRFLSSGPIHGSPTVGDLDGNGRLNIVFQSWGDWNDGAYTLNDRMWNIEENKLAASIDIKPGSYPNSINRKNQGTIPVALLSTPTLDATAVDPSTVMFAGASALPIGRSTKDVNGDGLPDVVFHFNTRDTDLQPDQTTACLTGMFPDGKLFEGCDTVRIVK